MKKIFLKILLVFLAITFFAYCKKKEDAAPSSVSTNGKFLFDEIISQDLKVNPSGYAPLTATLQITTKVPTMAKLLLVGKNGPSSNLLLENNQLSLNHNFTILGLYPDYTNIVGLTLYDTKGKNLGTSAVAINTETLSLELPSISIDVSLPGKKPGMTLVSYLANTSATFKTPFIFDEFGNIRWYLDYSSHPLLNTVYYENGLERLLNGNFYFGNTADHTIYEINMLGEILNSWPIVGYKFHHQVFEKPNGNFIVSVTKIGLPTIEDFIIEIDRNSKQIVTEWDLRQCLQAGRRTLASSSSDWMHVNALFFDQRDNTILVSGRTQCVAKIDQNNKVVWILGAHRGWLTAGDGTNLISKLLQPLDRNGQLISDTSVLSGASNHPDFEWNWYQHAIKIMPNGHFSLFDNGDKRNFVSTGPYSRAVEYEIDENAMTVKQIWQYGKERGLDTYSRIVSDVDYLPDQNHFIFSPGSGQSNGKFGKIIEVSKGNNMVVFEATIFAPVAYKSVPTFHRSERINLYP